MTKESEEAGETVDSAIIRYPCCSILNVQNYKIKSKAGEKNKIIPQKTNQVKSKIECIKFKAITLCYNT
jgi:hypothetical protein